MTHVDASKQSNMWAKENAKLSAVPEDGYAAGYTPISFLQLTENIFGKTGNEYEYGDRKFKNRI